MQGGIQVGLQRTVAAVGEGTCHYAECSVLHTRYTALHRQAGRIAQQKA